MGETSPITSLLDSSRSSRVPASGSSAAVIAEMDAVGIDRGRDINAVVDEQGDAYLAGSFPK